MTSAASGPWSWTEDTPTQRVVHLEGCGPPLLRWLRSNIQTVGCYAIARSCWSRGWSSCWPFSW